MTSARNRDRSEDTKLAGEAADWLIALDEDAGAATRAAFFAWIQQSARHVREFLFVTEEFRKLDLLDPERSIEVDKLLANVASNVVPLQFSIDQEKQLAAAPAEKTSKKIVRVRWAAGIAAAAAAALLIFLSPWSASILNRSQEYATGRGEQRSFKLADASMVHLNAESRVVVDYSNRLRRIRLLTGEALFVAAPDASRPFLVDTGTSIVQAVGTQFNVYRRDNETTVSVIEGAVKVTASGQQRIKILRTAPPGKQEQSLLQAGEEARVADAGDIVRRTAPDITRALAWRQRRLVFQDDRLADVAKEFNRYNASQIQVQGIAQDKQLIGIFNADDPQSLLLFLAKDRALEIVRSGENIVIRSR